MIRFISIVLCLGLALWSVPSVYAQCAACNTGRQKVKIALRLSARLAGKVTTTVTVAGQTKATIPMSAGSVAFDSNTSRYYAVTFGNGEWADTQVFELELDNGISQELVCTTVWETDSSNPAYAELDPNDPNIYQGLNFPSAGCLSYWLDPGSGEYVRFEMSSLVQTIYQGRNVARLQVKLGDGVNTDAMGDSSGPIAGVNGPFSPRTDYLDTKPLRSRFAAAALPNMAALPSVKVPAQHLAIQPQATTGVASAAPTNSALPQAVFRQEVALASERFVVPGPIQNHAARPILARSFLAKGAVAAAAPAANAAPPPSVSAAPVGALFLPIKLGGDQGRLFYSVSAINSSAYSPTQLSLSSGDRVVHRITDGGGALRQILLVDAFIDIRTLSGTAFAVRFYSPTQIGSFNPGTGLYPIVDDTPAAVWRVENPDALPSANRVRFTETRNGVTHVHLATWSAANGATPGRMTLSLNDGQVIETRDYTLGTFGDANIRQQRITRRGPGAEGPVASDVMEVWQEFYHWGQPGQVFEALIQRIEDPDVAALTTNYIYYDVSTMPANSLNAVIYPDGYWEVYQRFNTGEVAQTYRPYCDTPASPFDAIDRSNCRFSEVIYTDYSTAIQLREETEYVLGVVVRGTGLWKQLENGTLTETTQRLLNRNQYTESQQVITSHREPPIFELNEEGTTLQRLTEFGWWNPQTKVFTRNRSATLPKAKRMFVVHGSTDHQAGVANRTLIDVTVEDEHGRAVCEEQFVNTTGVLPIPSSWARTDAISRNVHTYNARGLLTTIERNGAVVYEAGYLANNRLDWEIDEAGVKTVYTYDAFGRVETKVRTFAATDPVQTTTLTYDAAGNLRFETLSATKANVTRTLTTEFQYDLAGRMTQTISPEGLTTATTEEIFSDANNQPLAKRVTVTAPSGQATSTEYYRDRRLWSITGSAIAPTFYYYNYNSTEAGDFEYAQTYRDAAATDFRGETVTDWLGHTIQTATPGFRGAASVIRTYTFDGGPGSDGAIRGLLSSVTEPGRAATLFEYDEFGMQIAVGLDADGNGVLDRASTEPITLSSLVYERANGTAPWFRVTQQSKLFTSASDVATVVGETREQLTGLAAGVVDQREELGGDGRRILEKTSVARATKTRIVERRDTAALASTAAETETSIAGRVRTLRRAGAAADVAYAYDSLGRIESASDPLSGTLTYAYNDVGQLLSTTDSAAVPRVTRYTYHPDGGVGAGQMATMTDAASFVTHYAYTETGQLYRQWGRNVLPTEYGFDDEGRLTSLRTFRTQDTQNGGDVDWGQETWPTNAPAGDLTQWVYDAPSGLLEFKRAADFTAADATPIQQSFTYDAALRLHTRTNARGQTVTRDYDALGQLATVTYSGGSGAADLTFGYDRAGRLQSVIDGAGSRTLTTTAFGQPDDDVYTAGLLAGLTVNRSFDASRRPFGVTVAGAVGLTYGYDGYSRLGTITDSRDAAAMTFTYGYTAGTGRVETVEVRRAGTLRLKAKRTFDTLGRLSGTEARNASDQLLVSHGYTGFDALDRRTQVTHEDGKRWDYGYDPRGEVVAASKSFPAGEGGQELNGWSASYLYDSIGNRIAASDAGSTLPAVGSPLRADYTTNAVNEYEQRTVPAWQAITGDAAAAATIGVTVNDSPLAVVRQGAAGAQKFWTADWLPTNAAAAAFGQVRVQATVPGKAPAGSVGTVFLQKTPEVFLHDRDGNLTQDGRWNYTWDAENRLIGMETRPELIQPSGVLPVEQRTKLEFGYDFAGRRVQKRVSSWNLSLGTWTLERDQRFLWDGWNLLAEFIVPLGTSNLSLVRSYTWGIDLSGSFQGAGGVGGLLAIHQSATVCQLPAYDGNGNVAAVFDANSMAEVARFDYDAFGKTLQALGSGLASTPFRFSTKYQDYETGLLYYGLRYYNPSTGRWPSRDPIGENGGANLYGMLGNDAADRFDVLGLYSAAPVPTLLPISPIKVPMAPVPVGTNGIAQALATYGALLAYDIAVEKATREYLAWENQHYSDVPISEPAGDPNQAANAQRLALRLNFKLTDCKCSDPNTAGPIKYGDLDSRGRATYVSGVVTNANRTQPPPNAPNLPPSIPNRRLEPVGWNQLGRNRARTHLWANRNGGSGATLQNLIPAQHDPFNLINPAK